MSTAPAQSPAADDAQSVVVSLYQKHQKIYPRAVSGWFARWRIALVLALVIPATIATTVIVLGVLGQTINIMTLGGIAAAVGLMIDDSIVIIENIFNLPGMGRLVIDAISRRDYPLVQGALMVLAFLFVAVNLLVDVIYTWVDPRVRHG